MEKKFADKDHDQISLMFERMNLICIYKKIKKTNNNNNND